MTEFMVDPDTLELIRQLAERQGEHVDAIRGHLESHTTLNDVGGLIMAFLAPMYDSGRENAVQGFAQGKAVCEAVAQVAEESRQAYLDADEECRAGLEDACAGSGIDVPAAPPPGSGVELPPATGVIGPGEAPEGSGIWSNLREHTVSSIDTTRSLVDGAGKTGADGYANRVMPRTELPGGVQAFDNFRVRRPFDVMMNNAVDSAWEAADDRWGQHGATSSLRDRFEQRQYAAWGESYDSGLTTTSRAPEAPYASSWVDNNMSVRTWQAGQDVAGLYGQSRGAYDAVNAAMETGESLQTVRATAGGPDNTASHDWAQDR
ncbi:MULTISPECIES: hypothetical protein [unclassified Pseudactinotalea]|uniref:hypothetical protein n=1 Tax=Micrococcales TaxID=85006 RepID=UPI003C7C40E8